MATWNAAFNASPAGGDNPSQGDDKIREFKVAVYDRVVKEHNFDLTEGGAQPRQGLHRAGSAVAFCQASAPTQRNGVALGTADAGIIWIDSSIGTEYYWTGSAWTIVSAAPAVGMTYFQLPGYDAPMTLFPNTTWTNISSVFAGDFFRAEGGNASAFESGRQAQNIQPHTHTYIRALVASSPHAGTGSGVASAVDDTNNATTGSTGTTETRPQNQTIRIWVRTA